MRITFSKGSAGKYIGDYGQDKPKFGRNWFYILPNIHWNKGKFYKNEVTDISLHWLFYWVGIVIWGN